MRQPSRERRTQAYMQALRSRFLEQSHYITIVMKSFEIHLNDLSRIIFGEVPPTFFLEIILRTFIVYLVLMVSMRLMGKRISSELQRNELAALVTLAAAIGVPMHEPTRGLLPS